MKKAIIFDIGGVWESDAYESIFLTKETGLADRLGLCPQLILAAQHNTSTPIYSRSATVDEYLKTISGWYNAQMAKELEGPNATYYQKFDSYFHIDQKFLELYKAAEEHLVISNPYAPLAVKELKKRGYTIGICSNTSTFYWEASKHRHNVKTWANPNLMFASCEVGAVKGTGTKMFQTVEGALQQQGIKQALFIDDRQHNVADAKRIASIGALWYDSILHPEEDQIFAADDAYVHYDFKPFGVEGIIEALENSPVLG